MNRRSHAASANASVIGCAISSLVFRRHLTDAQAGSIVHAFSRGFWVGFGFAVVALVATIALIRERDVSAEQVEELLEEPA